MRRRAARSSKGTQRAQETLCLDKMTMHEKQKLAVTFGELVYNGQWFTPLREALSAFVTKTQEHVTGTVRLKLYKGQHDQRRCLEPVLPVLRGDRHLRRERLQPGGRRRLHPVSTVCRSPCRQRLTARACKRYNKYIEMIFSRAGSPGAGRSFQKPRRVSPAGAKKFRSFSPAAYGGEKYRSARKRARMARALQRAAVFHREPSEAVLCGDNARRETITMAKIVGGPHGRRDRSGRGRFQLLHPFRQPHVPRGHHGQHGARGDARRAAHPPAGGRRCHHRRAAGHSG